MGYKKAELPRAIDAGHTDFRKVVCELCGGDFYTVRPLGEARTCSNKCRHTAYLARKYATTNVDAKKEDEEAALLADLDKENKKSTELLKK